MLTLRLWSVEQAARLSQMDKAALGKPFLGPLSTFLVTQILIQGVKKKCSEASLALVGTLDQVAIQDDFVEKTLG